MCPTFLRLSAKEAFLHPWVQNQGVLPLPKKDFLCSTMNNLNVFRNLNKLSDSISNFICSQIMTIHETKDLREIFKIIDLNGDGKLSKEEIIKGFEAYKGSKAKSKSINRIMEEVDTNRSGFIDYNEFIKASVSENCLYSKKNVKEAFDLVDLDGSGKISSDEFEIIFSACNLKESTWKELVLQADKNLDGEIDYEEFSKFIEILLNHKIINDNY